MKKPKCTCECCVFWDDNYYKEDLGYCRKNAPTGTSGTVFPLTGPTDWCGKGRLKKEGMTVREIARDYLLSNDFDGLAGDGCGCDIKDLMECGSDCIGDCEPGYKIECDCGDHDYHITTNKQ